LVIRYTMVSLRAALILASAASASTLKTSLLGPRGRDDCW
jgi:hypothetical protein